MGMERTWPAFLKSQRTTGAGVSPPGQLPPRRGPTPCVPVTEPLTWRCRSGAAPMGEGRQKTHNPHGGGTVYDQPGVGPKRAAGPEWTCNGSQGSSPSRPCPRSPAMPAGQALVRGSQDAARHHTRPRGMAFLWRHTASIAWRAKRRSRARRAHWHCRPSPCRPGPGLAGRSGIRPRLRSAHGRGMLDWQAFSFISSAVIPNRPRDQGPAELLSGRMAHCPEWPNQPPGAWRIARSGR